MAQQAIYKTGTTLFVVIFRDGSQISSIRVPTLLPAELDSENVMQAKAAGQIEKPELRASRAVQPTARGGQSLPAIETTHWSGG